jgi:UDP-glucose 4-epimerase
VNSLSRQTQNSFFFGAKVMVTGGLGFIGSNVARRLVELGCDVTVVDSMLPNGGANRANLQDLDGKLQVKIADLQRSEEIAPLLPGNDIIFNFAGKSSHADSMTDPLADLNANVYAHVVLLEACRRAIPKAKIVFSSTRQIYGRPISCPVDETHPVRPLDVNGINKASGETYHTLYHRVYGLDTICLRLTNTFGPRMRIKDARQNFLGVWLRRVVENDALEVWGGNQKRDLTYIDDAVEAFLASAQLSSPESRIFNIGGSPAISLADLAQLLVETAGSGSFAIKEFPAERLRIDMGDYFADDRLFRKATGWAPEVTLADGLARSVAFYNDRLSDYV